RPLVVLSPRAALFSPKETLPLSAAEGRISAVQIAPYPPGVPIVAPGEVISKKHLAYLARIGYNMKDKIEVVL
ncbi:MAG: amino acid decarboxylase, partial [Oscillospiraceae bacterium]